MDWILARTRKGLARDDTAAAIFSVHVTLLFSFVNEVRTYDREGWGSGRKALDGRDFLLALLSLMYNGRAFLSCSMPTPRLDRGMCMENYILFAFLYSFPEP